jgi:DNA polymerase III sliding clamp (beta) subunit (PCNA family)
MITIQQESLFAALNAVARASLKSSLMAAFSLVRLDASPNGALSLSCFNGETAARALTLAACDDGLSVCVDAQTLRDVVETLAGEIQIGLDEKAVILKNGANRTTLRIVEESIPTIGQEDIQVIASLPGSLLRSLLRALPFASADDTRPNLQVLHLTFSEEAATARGADGFTVGIVTENIQGPTQPVVLPLPGSVGRLLSGLVEEGDTVQVQSSGSNHYLFQVTNPNTAKSLTLASVAGPENFPAEQIEQLLAAARQEACTNFSISKHSLAQTVRMVAAMGTHAAFIKISNGAIKVASEETQVGQARNILEGETSGQDIQAWVSASLLKRAADACRSQITMRMSGEKKPLLVEEANFTALIMPLSPVGYKDPFADDEAIPLTLPEMALPA